MAGIGRRRIERTGLGPTIALSVLAALYVLAGWNGAARADDFTPQERAEIVAILRDALKRDPSILRDAVTALQADNDAKSAAAAASAIARHRAELMATSRGMVAGNPRARVTVVEFYDTRCPYCRRMAPEVAALLAADPSVRWIYKDFPVLGDSSVMEAKALLAADRQGGYARLQALFLKQGGTQSLDHVATLAASVGLDGKRLLADMQDPAIAAAIEANLALGQALGIGGTPAFVIGDQLVPGAMDLDDLRKLVAAAS